MKHSSNVVLSELAPAFYIKHEQQKFVARYEYCNNIFSLCFLNMWEACITFLIDCLSFLLLVSFYLQLLWQIGSLNLWM